MEEVVVVYQAPVPVGHRVEIRWYQQTKEGLFGGKKTKERPFEPVIKDLDTGIEYLTDFLPGANTGGKLPDIPLRVDLDALKTGEVTRTLVGRVVSCQVVTIRGFSDYDVQTHLMIEPEG